jgi:protein TorT
MRIKRRAISLSRLGIAIGAGLIIFGAATMGAGAGGGQSPAQLAALLGKANWSYPAEFINCKTATPNGCNSNKKVSGSYTPLPVSQITKPWKICVSFPHLKDPYWLSVAYGALQESKRDKVKMKLVEAGGYTNLPTQLDQLDNCAAAGADALVIGGISYTGLDAKIQQLRGQGKTVIDIINGLNSPKVNAHALVSYYDMGYVAGKYLAKLSQTQTVHVGWFPGPPGAGWVETSNTGFRAAIKGSKVKVLTTRYGDTGKDVQTSLVQDALSAFPDMNFIAGTAVTATAAESTLAARHLTGKIKVLADYIIPEVYQDIVKGKIACASNDQAVVQARMGIDEAVRVLEKKPFVKGDARTGPRVQLICGPSAGKDNNLKTQFVYPATFAPASFKPVFTVNGGF